MRTRTLASLLLAFSLAPLILLGQTSEVFVIVGAGNSGSWHTEFEFANSLDVPIHAGVGIAELAGQPCVTGFCPFKGFDMPAGGTMRENSLGPPEVWDGVRTYVVAGDGHPLPTTRAWLVNRDRPTQTIELPVVNWDTITALQPTLLAFPSAERSASSHSNLIVAELAGAEALPVSVEALSSAGQLLGAKEFTVPAGRTLFMVDVLHELGVSDVLNGQVRVRRLGGNGLLWGLLAILQDDGRIAVSQGATP